MSAVGHASDLIVTTSKAMNCLHVRFFVCGTLQFIRAYMVQCCAIGSIQRHINDACYLINSLGTLFFFFLFTGTALAPCYWVRVAKCNKYIYNLYIYIIIYTKQKCQCRQKSWMITFFFFGENHEWLLITNGNEKKVSKKTRV